MRLGEEEHHSIGIRRRLAHRRNIKRCNIISGATSTIFQPQSTPQSLHHNNLFASWESTSADIQTVTSQSVLRDNYYNVLKNMDLDDNSNPTSTPSLRRPPAQQDSHLDPDRHHICCKVVGMLIWAVQARPDLQFTAKGHARHLASPTELDWQHLKHTLRYLKGTMHYKLLIPPQLPQGHSLPLHQLIPLHINTYCDSDWPQTPIDSRKSTSGTSGVQQQSSEHSRYIKRRSRAPCHRPQHQRQPSLTSDTSVTLATTTRQRHRPKACIIVATLFSVLHSSLCSHQSLTSCCHLTSSQLAKVYINCTIHRRKLTATSTTSSTSRNRPSSSVSTSCPRQPKQHRTSATSVELLEEW